MNTFLAVLSLLLFVGAVVGQFDSFTGGLGFGGGSGTSSAALSAGSGGGSVLDAALSAGSSGGSAGGFQLPAGLLGQAGGLFGQSGLTSPGGGRFSSMSSLVSSGANSLRDTLGSLQSGSSMGLDVMSNGIGSGATAATQTFSSASDAGRQMLNTFMGLKATAIKNTKDIVNQALDIVDHLSSSVPIAGPVISMGTSIGRQTTDAITNAGLGLLGQLQTQANQNLDTVNGAAQAATAAAADSAMAGLSVTHNGVGLGLGSAGAAVDTGEGIAHGVLSALDSALDAGTSLGAGAQSSLTSSLQSDLLPSASQVTATVSSAPGTLALAGGIN